MKEVWKDVVGYEKYYMVSNKGRVKTKDRIVTNNIGTYTRPSKLCKLCLSSGYPALRLTKDKIGKLKRVHRLVAEAFIKNPTNLPFVNHKDGNKENNSVLNLEWCNNKMNCQHASKINLIPKGSKKYNAILSEQKVKEIKKLLNENKTIKSIAKQFNVSYYVIREISNNKNWKHV